jgi:acetate kinase
MGAILVVNAGSSSVKFALFEPVAATPTPNLIGKGRVAKVGDHVELVVKGANGTLLEKQQLASASSSFDYDQAMTLMMAWLANHESGPQVAAVGHRVVHGGQTYVNPVLLNADIQRELEAHVPLAPLHQPHNLKAIRILGEHLPGVPHIACFDTAFHSTQPATAQAFALPRELTEAGVRRYGFHGLSYEYIATQLPRVLGEQAGGRVIVAHLGNGASLCAIRHGKSVASTMGFSALDGLMMGTRCGMLDAGVVLYLLQQLKMSPQEVTDLLYNRSGLLGVSGISSDMQVLLQSDDRRAAEAIALFVHRIVCDIGSLAAAMGGVDALVFTAGIGQHAAPIRARICEGCEWLGARIDQNANSGGHEKIHAVSSAISLAVIPTDEELMIAVHTQRCAGWVGDGRA